MQPQFQPSSVVPVFCIEGNHKGYDAICREAKLLGWPQLWAEDLYVLDRDRLQKSGAPQEFAWAIRKTRTFLLFPGIAEDLEVANALLFNRDKGNWTEQRYYWFNGTMLRSIALETIIDRLKRFRPPPPTTQER